MSIQLLEHLNKNNILVEEQFGFRTKMSTDAAIFKLTNGIQKALNRKNLIGGIFCDLLVSFTRFCYQNWNSMLLKVMQMYGLNHISETVIKGS
jgi:hypothetical protein